MSEQISLKQVERKAFRLNMEDGLLDIQIGLVMLILGISTLLGEAGVSSWIFLIAIVVAVIMQGILRLVKRAVSLPRIGQIKFSPARKRRVKTLAGITVAAVVLSFVVVGAIRYAAQGEAASGLVIWSIVMFFAVLVLGVFVGMTYFLDEPRLMVHGLMIFVAVPSSFALQELTDLSSALPTLLVGSIALTMGIVILRRFLKKYPNPSQMDMSHGEE